ncbi:MAG: tyrosine-type recombinase/integrase [Clostridium sp.]|uniref:tyrosine-type recombinase/integrase n=1 Tax=Clostridium sp. TaxID=1506 RepID=UPI003EE548D0
MREVKPIDDEKVEEIKKELKDKSIRNYIMFELGISLGLRIGDILKLKVKDIYDKDTMYLKEQKTNKYKEVPIAPKLKRLLKEFCKDREGYEYLIKSRKGFNEPIRRNRAYKILREVSVKVGIERIGTHSMRKTFGRKYYKTYGDIEELRKYFNHSNAGVTRRYIGIEQDVINNRIKKLWN